jgi:hypothetical protein
MSKIPMVQDIFRTFVSGGLARAPSRYLMLFRVEQRVHVEIAALFPWVEGKCRSQRTRTRKQHIPRV